MPAEYPAVDEWPARFNEGRTNQQYINILKRLKTQPANKIRVVAVGLKKSDAMNLRAWLNDPEREGVTARTTEVVLRLVEDMEYPDWRQIEANREQESAELMAFTSHTLGALAKLGDLYRGYSIDWTLSGDRGVVRYKIGPIGGLLMPARNSTTPDVIEDDQS